MQQQIFASHEAHLCDIPRQFDEFIDVAGFAKTDVRQAPYWKAQRRYQQLQNQTKGVAQDMGPFNRG